MLCMLCMYFSLKRELLEAAKDTASGLIMRGMTGQTEGSKGLYTPVKLSEMDGSGHSSVAGALDEEGGIELSTHSSSSPAAFNNVTTNNGVNPLQNT